MSERVLFVTTRLFWPTDSGRKMSLYHYCEGMSKQCGYEVHLYSFLEGDQRPELAESKPAFVESVSVACPIPGKTKMLNLLRSLSKPWVPFQCSLYCDRENMDRISDLAKRLKPDIVLIDMVRLAPYIMAFRDIPCATVIDFDDLLSKRYLRQGGKTRGNVLGKYETQAPGLFSRLVNNPFLAGIALRMEAGRIERAESHYAAEYDACLFVSPAEADELDERTGLSNCFHATMGAEVCHPIGAHGGNVFDCGFVGNMHTSANQDSLRFIIEKVLPLIPEATLRVIGVCPGDVAKQYSCYENVSFTGKVDSIQEQLGQCRLMLAPFAYGSGIKTKILEAMGFGVPVVTNSLGLEGLNAESGVEILKGDTPQDIAQAVRRLLGDDSFRESISQAGQRYVMENHQWGKSIEDLRRCIQYAQAAASKRAKRE